MGRTGVRGWVVGDAHCFLDWWVPGSVIAVKIRVVITAFQLEARGGVEGRVREAVWCGGGGLTKSSVLTGSSGCVLLVMALGS